MPPGRPSPAHRLDPILEIWKPNRSTGVDHADDSRQGLPPNAVQPAGLQARDHRLGDSGLEGQPTLGPSKLQPTALDRCPNGRLAEVDDRIVVIARSPARHVRSMPDRPYPAITAARRPIVIRRIGPSFMQTMVIAV